MVTSLTRSQAAINDLVWVDGAIVDSCSHSHTGAKHRLEFDDVPLRIQEIPVSR